MKLRQQKVINPHFRQMCTNAGVSVFPWFQDTNVSQNICEI
jgi:hypothetical protein